MNWQEILGIVGGALGNIGLIPQIWRLFRLKTAYEISLSFLCMWVAGIVCWLIYGILLGLFSVILWNAITMILAFAMMYAKLKWGLKPRLGTTFGNDD